MLLLQHLEGREELFRDLRGSLAGAQLCQNVGRDVVLHGRAGRDVTLGERNAAGWVVFTATLSLVAL